MAGITIPKKLLVFEYKRHKFYMDVLTPDCGLVHIDPKGQEIDSNVWDEQDAVDYVDGIEGLEE